MYNPNTLYSRDVYIINPLVGASLISGGAGLLGGFLGMSSQSKANSANLQATRETNEMNYKIAQMNNESNEQQTQKMLDWQRKQWEDTNQYNSASSQVQRYKEAGLNPYLMMQNGSAGSASAMGGTTPTRAEPVQMVAPHVEPITSGEFLSDSAVNALNSYLNYKEKTAQIKQIEIDNQTRLTENIGRIYNQYADTMSKKTANEYQKIQNKIADATKNDVESLVKSQADTQMFEAQLKAQQLTTQYLQNEMMRVNLAYLPAEKRSSLAQISSNIALQAAQRAKSLKEIDKIVAETISTEVGTSITRDQRDALIDITKESAKKIHNEVVSSGVPDGGSRWFKFWNAVSAAMRPVGTALGGLKGSH